MILDDTDTGEFTCDEFERIDVLIFDYGVERRGKCDVDSYEVVSPGVDFSVAFSSLKELFNVLWVPLALEDALIGAGTFPRLTIDFWEKLTPQIRSFMSSCFTYFS